MRLKISHFNVDVLTKSEKRSHFITVSLSFTKMIFINIMLWEKFIIM